MSEDKKIIIDEDWKSQVQSEKEQLEQSRQSAPDEPEAEGEGPAAGPGGMPPASFEMLITMLASEAMMALGQMPHPMTNQVEQNLDQAKYLIDTLGVIQEKTKGNLTPNEEQAMTELLHQLRMAFVSITQQA